MRSSTFVILQCLTTLTVGTKFRDWYQHMDAPDALRTDGQPPPVAIPFEIAQEFLDPYLYDRSGVPGVLDTLAPFVLRERTSRSFRFVLDARPQAPPLLDVSIGSLEPNHERQIYITVTVSNPRCPAPQLQKWRSPSTHVGTEMIDTWAPQILPQQNVYRFSPRLVGGRWTSEQDQKMVLRIPRHNPRDCVYEISQYEIQEIWRNERHVPQRFRALQQGTSQYTRALLE